MKKSFAEKRILFVFFLSVMFFAFSTGLSAAADENENRSSYDIISDTVYCYKLKEAKAYEEIQTLLAELKQKDPQLGNAWEKVMNYWIYVNNDLEVNYNSLPDGLPSDNSLCIIVLGYQLNADGSMSEELVGRCSVALECAKKYPNAYVAVTGGGTALQNRMATEAEAMADWLAEHGLERERIIVENQSQTTYENAQFTCRILMDEYPSVRYAAIVSSDYHIPLGCLLFREQFVLAAYKEGREDIWVASNAGFQAKGLFASPATVREQATDLWMVASILDEIN